MQTAARRNAAALHVSSGTLSCALDARCEQINLKWEDFQETDNSCGAAESKLEELEADLQFVESRVTQLVAHLCPRAFAGSCCFDAASLITD